MDTCKICSQKFNFWQVYKNHWSVKEQIKCLNCLAPHNITITSRVLSSVFVIFVPGIIQATIQDWDKLKVFGIWSIIVLYLLVSLIMSLLTNPLLRYKSIKNRAQRNLKK